MNRLKKIWPFLVLISLIIASLHFFIFNNLKESLILEHEIFLNFITIILNCGAILIISSFLISTSPLKLKLKSIIFAGYLWMGFFHILFFISLVDAILKLIVEHNYSYLIPIISFPIFIYSLYNGFKKPEVVFYEINTKIKQSFSLIQISDLHIGMLHLNLKWLTKVVNVINQINPDFVVITGDLVEGPYEEVAPQLQVLNQIIAKKEKFYVTGNHEYIHETHSWENLLKSLGFSVLHNSHQIIEFNDQKLLMAGVPDRMVNRFKKDLNSQPDMALKSDIETQYKILLAHEPSSVFDIKEQSCDLILSGHTHGGQIFPFNFLVRLVQPVVKGFKTINSVLVFAHQGTGFWGPPLRLFTRSEIVLFNFKNKDIVSKT